MPLLKCPVPPCIWSNECELNSEQCMEMVKLHVSVCHSVAAVAESSSGKSPKLNRPIVDVGIDQENWDSFVVRWKQFLVASHISKSTESLQLFHCASEELGNLLLKSNPALTDMPVDELLSLMYSFAVIRVAKGAQRAELMKMVQGSDETVRTFVARVQGKARTCDFSVDGKCKCGDTVTVNYTQKVVKDVILAGLCDNEVQTSIFEIEGIDDKPLNDIISVIERKVCARKAYRSSDVSIISGYKSRQKSNSRASAAVRDKKPLPSKSRKTPCPECKKPFLQYNGRNITAFKNCYDCYISSRKRNCSKSLATIDSKVDDYECTPDVVSQNPTILGYDIVDVGMVKTGRPRAHPRVRVCVKINGMQTFVSAIADTGAQTNLWGLKDFQQAGFKRSQLEETSVRISAANQSSLRVVGMVNARFEGESSDGNTVSSQGIVFVSDSVSGFYLSYSTMIDLRIISRSFPTIGDCTVKVSPDVTSKPVFARHSFARHSLSIRSLNSGCMQKKDDICQCPQRSAVPLRPSTLPFPAVPENNKRMKDWLLNRFAASTFNTCPHKPLQQMAGPPVEIHIKRSAKPRVCYTPAQIPLHWQYKVKEDLLRDEALGIIERVPFGVPVTWCHRMVVTRKHDGSPRRTVDLSPLNRFCKREIFSSESPFHLARRVPKGNWKTVTDAWNGYHSVPLRASDRHLTTFITPFGRYRYTRAPQGFLSSGDGYNKRFDAILSDFKRKERCVDDTIFYDRGLEKHWWRTIDFLIKVGTSGVVLNPDKFQFARKSVDFAGFRITSETIEPLPRYVNAIKSFPVPKNLTDVKSWFGLINQVSNYSQLRGVMAPFRRFLSPKTKFEWGPELDKAFIHSKAAIVESIRTGVKIFDLEKRTCLRPDWSKKGIGYFLLQKHCQCSTIQPGCCTEGWKVTLAGSRFLSKAESRYAAIEGEALAIAWGLEQTRYFTQGCRDLLVVTDHKPLVRIFEDRTLDEIPNTRLFRIKQRTLPWYFRILYMPGSTNAAADAASRHPLPNYEVQLNTKEDLYEESITMAIHQEAEDLTTLAWETIVNETVKDPVLSELNRAIANGFVGAYNNIQPYMRFKDSFYVHNGAIMFNDRVVIPGSLRKLVLRSLHAAHQGVSTMLMRAQAIVYWPGMSKDLHDIRAGCKDCNQNAPSQATLPSEPSNPPLTPFEQIFSDFFQFAGFHYLVVGDRLSGWCEVFPTPTGSSSSGARGLVKCLRRLFSTFGVPQELSSDGGPEFTASLTKDFLHRWGVKHRQSSAYNPSSNGRAEVAVKCAKRLLRANVDHTGSLNSDNFLRAIMILRNTPDADCNVSPAQILFGRPLRDNLLFSHRLQKYAYPSMSGVWKRAWRSKEDALRSRFIRNSEDYNAKSRSLPPLKIGDNCLVQNCHGNYPKKWGLSGTVVETLPHQKYVIKIDGSGRVTTRNRRHLKVYTPATTFIEGRQAIPVNETEILPRCGGDDFIEAIPDTPVSPDRETPQPLSTRADDRDGGHTDRALSKPAGGKIPLALRRLRFDKPGPKQRMLNPLGRRAPLPECASPPEGDEE